MCKEYTFHHKTSDFVKKSHQSKSLASYCNVAMDWKKFIKSHFFDDASADARW